MNLDLITVFVYIIIPVLSAMGAFIFKSVHQRLDNLETRMHQAQTEGQVRQLISDKVDPIREDLKEIKEKIDKVFDLAIQNNNKRG